MMAERECAERKGGARAQPDPETNVDSAIDGAVPSENDDSDHDPQRGLS